MSEALPASRSATVAVSCDPCGDVVVGEGSTPSRAIGLVEAMRRAKTAKKIPQEILDAQDSLERRIRARFMAPPS